MVSPGWPSPQLMIKKEIPVYCFTISRGCPGMLSLRFINKSPLSGVYYVIWSKLPSHSWSLTENTEGARMCQAGSKIMYLAYTWELSIYLRLSWAFWTTVLHRVEQPSFSLSVHHYHLPSSINTHTTSQSIWLCKRGRKKSSKILLTEFMYVEAQCCLGYKGKVLCLLNRVEALTVCPSLHAALMSC